MIKNLKRKKKVEISLSLKLLFKLILTIQRNSTIFNSKEINPTRITKETNRPIGSRNVIPVPFILHENVNELTNVIKQRLRKDPKN